jgi:hypothetical protein
MGRGRQGRSQRLRPCGHLPAVICSGTSRCHDVVVAGYSGTPLARKIGIKDDQVVLLDGAPADLDLGDTGGAQLVRRLPPGSSGAHISRQSIDVSLTFHTSYAALARRLPVLFERTSTAGMVWVCWPKKAAQRSTRNPGGLTSDLDDNRVRTLGLELGFVDVKVAAIDDTWSGLKFVRRLADR